MLTNYREIGAEAREGLGAAVTGAAYLFSLEFPSGTGRFWTGNFPLSWEGETFHGVSEFVSVSEPAEAADTEAKQITIGLAGLENSDYAPSDLGDYQGGAAKLWFAAVDFVAKSLRGEPIPVFFGYLDADETTADPAGGTLSAAITVVRADADHLRVRPSRWTHEDQQLRHPEADDRGLEFVASTANTPVRWGGS